MPSPVWPQLKQKLLGCFFLRQVSFVLKSDTENVETSNAGIVFQIVDLLSALVGSPPDLPVVRDLMSMALLLHETTQTFVAHSRCRFL